MARFLGLRGARLTTAISTVCGLCFLCFGYAQGVMGGLLTVPIFLDRFPQVDVINRPTFHYAWLTGLTVGAWHLGCIVAAILTIFIGDILGRRRVLLLGLVFWVIGEIIQASSYSFGQFIAGRAIAGFGNGFTTSTAPTYQAECVKSHRKGTILMTTAGTFVAFGIALSYWFTFAFAFISRSSAAWRVPVAFQITFALPAIALLFVLPESPRWLILTGREQEALAVLAALNDVDVADFEVRDEFLQIKDAILIMAQGSSTGMFSNKERRSFHRVVLACFIQVFQQGTGINLVLQYLAWIFVTQLSYRGWVARLLASCSTTVYFLASFVAVVGIDRFWGRRSLMLFGAAGMSGCMVLVTVLQYLWTEHSNDGGRITGTIFLFIFSMFFAIGWQGMAWLYQVEIVPLRIRGPANALSTSANWILNFVIVFITPIAFQNISYRTWIIFASINLAIIPLIYFFYPETAYRSLEEVDVIFQVADDEPGNPWLSVVRISQQEPLWFGRQREKNFEYESSSWHKRLMESVSSNSSNEKRGRKHSSPFNGSRPGSDPYAHHPNFMRRRTESPIDPQLLPSPPMSPAPTITTTIHSEAPTTPRHTASFRRAHARESADPILEHDHGITALPSREVNKAARGRQRSSAPVTSVPYNTSSILTGSPSPPPSRNARYNAASHAHAVPFTHAHIPIPTYNLHTDRVRAAHESYNSYNSFNSYTTPDADPTTYEYPYPDDAGSFLSFPAPLSEGGDSDSMRARGSHRDSGHRSARSKEKRKSGASDLSGSGSASGKKWAAREAGRAY